MFYLRPLVPLFWISGDVSSGFQSQSGLPYSHCRGLCNVCSLRSTSGATHCQPLNGQQCGLAISDDGPILPPTGMLPKNWLGVELWSYAQECYALPLRYAGLNRFLLLFPLVLPG